MFRALMANTFRRSSNETSDNRRKQMKKILSLITILFCTVHFSFSGAPELKNMMPNSWQKLTRLSTQEELVFFNQQQVMHDIENVKSDSWASPEYIIAEKRVYKEIVNNIEFYRVLTCNQRMTEFFEADYNDKSVSEDYYENFRTRRIQQTIYARPKAKDIIKISALEYRVYGIAEGNMETEGCEYLIFNDVFIKALNKNEIGFFITEVNIEYQRKNIEQKCVLYYSKLKNQMRGSNSCKFLRVNNKEDFSKAFNDSNRRIRIHASNCLFDSKCPLKYSIQNAFDGNPATSYVENTDDDFMTISLPGYGKEYSGNFTISIINGYALNENLYKKNNRVKKINLVGYKLNDTKTELIERSPKILEFEDGDLSPQISSLDFVCFGPFYFKVSSIYSGNTYNDTCIAELNFKDKEEWFFGETND